MDTLLLLGVGWFVLACLLALLIGPILKDAGKPSHVSTRDWEKVSHLPHTPGFRSNRRS